MDIHHYSGMDIPKATLDWAVFEGKALVWQTTTLNSVAAIKTALRPLRTLAGWTPNKLCFAWSTPAFTTAPPADGLICRSFSTRRACPPYLVRKQYSTPIKQTGGMQGGKSAAVDARRIAE